MNLDAKLKHYRLSREELGRITELLGRAPEGVEWALFSALWSEHCSYKSSRVHLKKLFNESPRVLMSFGENAGVIDLGQGECIAFKMESHNHPSYIEPYEGAATGVGGILRDIFTMGARPIALANYLAFGSAGAPRMSTLVDGVVRGIGGYSNCVGVPTITGQTEFHSSYNKNILVNALALGLFRKGDPILSARAQGAGNLVVYVGAKTGKDGVHGASMASESFDSNSESKKPTIQKGDPFYEKLLIESCLEVMREGLVVAVQDMGAAGLTSSSFEMAARGEMGFELHLDRVPLRDSSMTPEEILLSESQERMLLIVMPENIEKVQRVFNRWDLDAEVIGKVTAGPNVELYWHGESICRMNPRVLVDEAPRYERPYDNWQPKNRVAKFDDTKVGKRPELAGDIEKQLIKILAHPTGTSRSWIYQQYDQRVGAKTAFDCSENIGVIRLPDSRRALGLVLGGRPHAMRFDAQIGGIDSVAFPALELAAKGFLPLAITDCLNYGNPENREIMSEFVASLEGMSEQARALAAPIISGNVSFYNETLGENITSTPATGLVGIRDSGLDSAAKNGQTKESLPHSSFVYARDEIYCFETPQVKFNGMAAELNGNPLRGVGVLDPKIVNEFARVVRHLALSPSVRSSRVVGKYGLPYALARMCNGRLGATVQLPAASHQNWHAAADTYEGWFGETLYQVIFAVDSDRAFEWRQLCEKLSSTFNFKLTRLGEVREGHLTINHAGAASQSGMQINLPVEKIREAYETPWEVLFAGLS